MMSKIAITMGDPAGIGPEIIIKSLEHISDVSGLMIVGNLDIFKKYENVLNKKLPPKIDFVDIPFDTDKIQCGVESVYSGELSYLSLKKACGLVNSSVARCIVTAPLSKNALHMSGHIYSGQTEILQQELSDNADKAQMLFVANNLRILLLTRHVPLRDIPDMISRDSIVETAKIFDKEIKEKFNIKNPRIAMCALNPHAGENGILGREEIEIINPTLKKLRSEGVNISGAYSADTLLGKAVKNYQSPDFDGYIACYHDQALPAIKSLGLENVLNVTIGLKALRVSPSHGTAFDIAGKNKADYRSMLNSILYLMSL